MPVKKRYSKDMEDQLSTAYLGASTEEERKHVVLTYVEKWNLSEKSVIAKLAKMHIYEAVAKVSKVTGEAPKTKENIVKDIAKAMRVPLEEVIGLEKAPKLVLILLLGKLKND
jgi:mannose/cellobiose epimerase-like protein (N-acyl-D-glucosamine 2-epimerase family)